MSTKKPMAVAKKPRKNVKHTETVSRQRLWQRLKNEAGLCAGCGAQPRYENATLCKTCLLAVRARVRKQGGYRAWKPGGRGRKPVEIR